MRLSVLLLALAPAGAGLVSAPALASTVSETLSFSGSPDCCGNTVSGPVFNPALGTLTGLTMTASGFYTPDVYVGDPVTSTASVLYVDLFTVGPGSKLMTIADGGENLAYSSNGYLTGPAEAFSETATVTNALALSEVYTAFGPYQSGGLLTLDVFSKSATPGAWAFTDDVSKYAGTLTVAFSYTPSVLVPEPDGLALLGIGIAGVLTSRYRLRRAFC